LQGSISAIYVAMTSSAYHLPRQEPTSVNQPESDPVDKITWVYVAVGVVPVIFVCCGILHYIRKYRHKKLQADKPVDIEMQPGEVRFAQVDWDDDPKITKVTGNPNSVWNQLESMTTEQLGASAKPGNPWQPTPDFYGFGDNAASDYGPRYGDTTRNETDLVRPPVSVANPARLSKGKSDVLRSVVDCPAPAAEAEPSPSRSSWTTCRPASSVYSADHVEPPPIPPMPAIDEASGSHFSKMDDEINRIVNSRILAPADYDERRQVLFKSSERQRLAKQHTVERPANPRKESHNGQRGRPRTHKHRKHQSKAEYGRSTLVQGGWERKKKDSDRRRRSQSGPPTVGHRPAERDRLELEARRSGREPEHHRGHRQGKPPKKDEKPSGWFDKMTERLVTGAAR
jgi:hypothetical protein